MVWQKSIYIQLNFTIGKSAFGQQEYNLGNKCSTAEFSGIRKEKDKRSFKIGK